jgi:membrane protease YdiL (CAAX protease family)
MLARAADRDIDARPGRTIVGVAAAIVLSAVLIGVWPRLADRLVGAAGITDAAGGEAVFTVLVFGAIGLVAVAGGWMLGLKPWALGVRPGAMLGAGAVTGIAAFALAIVYTGLAGTLGVGAGASSGISLLAAGIVVVMLQVVAEETYFRGWVQPMLARATGTAPAVLATGTAFGLLHAFAGATGVVTLLNMIAGGVLFGVLAARGGGIAGAIGAHGAWNLTEQLGVGLDPNPGVGSFGALADWDLHGATAWGGSADGLNGSWAMLFALLAAVATTALLPWRHR